MPGFRTFSTLGYDNARRIELWEEHNARSLVGLSARTLDGNALDATEINLELEQLRFAHVTANAHVVERTAAEIARTPADGIALYFTIFGESFFYHRDGVVLQRPGGILVCDTSEPFMRGFAQGLQEFVLTIPRTLFADLSEEAATRQPRTLSFASIPGANAHATSLATLLRSTLAAPTVAQLAQAEQTAIELLRAIFSGDVARAAASYRYSAVVYIDRHLRDPRLGVGDVARAVGLSERHLARIFAETGVGLARIILDKRLDLARRLLASPGAPSIGDVAGQCGFASHAHFTR
ncbi:MAG: helix-turn-helix domain-containing protein, partial [Rhodoglobus sp.]